MRTRFAPSPTGHLHLGHIYAAQIAQHLAKKNQGQCLLRYEDIDETRTKEHFYQHIVEDLAFLDIHFPSSRLRQTSRTISYQTALTKLIQKELVYPCFCSRKDIASELSSIVNAPHGPEGALYPQTCLSLSKHEIDQRIAQGQTPSWRLHTTNVKSQFPPLTFTDSLLGKTAVNFDLLGDVILARKDIGTSYHIAVVVDDAYQCITHVSRGEDLLHSTHIHRVLQHALELPEPAYYHHPLICDAHGKRLAKRHESQSIRHLRATGHSKKAILNILPLLPLE